MPERRALWYRKVFLPDRASELPTCPRKLGVIRREVIKDMSEDPFGFGIRLKC